MTAGAPRRAAAILCMVVVAYFAVFGWTREEERTTPLPSIAGLSPQEAKDEKEWALGKRNQEGEGQRPDNREQQQMTGEVETKQGVPYLVPAFGYNKKRNVKRWEMIYNSIKADGTDPESAISVVDYGADEGYFSISTAFAFPQSQVVALDMGGVGGSIWKKGGYDVLKIQEGKIDAYGVAPRVKICQTAAKPEHFFALDAAKTGHDYQFVLSVFHWFTMPDRQSFEEVLVKLLSNAKATFIELPIAGDFGPRFMKQVGSQHFVKWYDGRSDIKRILEESLKARGAAGRVTKVGSVAWLPGDKKKGEKDWDREVFRVDMESVPHPFDCGSHFSVYSCAVTTSPAPVKYSSCM